MCADVTEAMLADALVLPGHETARLYTALSKRVRSSSSSSSSSS